jgi:hypothetical protein
LVVQQVVRHPEDKTLGIFDGVVPGGLDDAQEHLLGQILGLDAVLDPAQEEGHQGRTETGGQLLAQFVRGQGECGR